MLKRVITALVGIPIVCAAASAPSPIPFAVVCCLAILVACREARDLAQVDLRAKNDAAWTAISGLIIMLAVGGLALATAPMATKGMLISLIAAACLVLTWFRFKAVASWWPFACLVPLMLFQNEPARTGFALSLPLAVMIPLWVGDSLALFVGKAVGKHPIAPEISPNKTWEGAIANLIGASIAAVIVAKYYSPAPHQTVILSIATGFFGQCGDFFESALKRRASVKDSGNLLPGHGGILDRLDSLCFATPAYLLLLWISQNLP